MPRWTEKQIEAWLEPETRTLPMPDGRELAFTTEKIVWTAYEYLLGWGYSAEELVERAIVDGREMGRPFELSFTHVVSYMQTAFRKRFGDLEPRTFNAPGPDHGRGSAVSLAVWVSDFGDPSRPLIVLTAVPRASRPAS